VDASGKGKDKLYGETRSITKAFGESDHSQFFLDGIGVLECNIEAMNKRLCHPVRSHLESGLTRFESA